MLIGVFVIYPIENEQSITIIFKILLDIVSPEPKKYFRSFLVNIKYSCFSIKYIISICYNYSASGNPKFLPAIQSVQGFVFPGKNY